MRESQLLDYLTHGLRDDHPADLRGSRIGESGDRALDRILDPVHALALVDCKPNLLNDLAQHLLAGVCGSLRERWGSELADNRGRGPRDSTLLGHEFHKQSAGQRTIRKPLNNPLEYCLPGEASFL